MIKHDIVIAGKFDIPQARSKVRTSLGMGVYSPMFVAKSAMIFTGLCELLFDMNHDQPLDIHMVATDGSVTFTCEFLGAAAAISHLRQSLTKMEGMFHDYNILPENGHLTLSVSTNVER